MKKNNSYFDSLVRSFYRPLYRYAFWISKDKQIAEDLVQETFTRAWKNIHQLKKVDAAKPWLFTILNRENARRFSRKQLPMKELTEDWDMEHIADKNNDLHDLSLQRAIMTLSDDYRDPLVLQIVAGFSTDEIASLLKLKSNTVSTRLFRARAELRSLMTKVDSKKGKYNG